VSRRGPPYDRAFFLAALERVAGRDYRGRLVIGGTRSCPLRADDPPERIHPVPRLLVMLQGCQRYDLSIGGMRRTVTFTAGDALYWPPAAWNLERWEGPCRFLGVVMRPGFLRVILVDFPGGRPPTGATPHAYHTALPLTGAGLLTARALAVLGDGPADASGVHLFNALLGLAHRHVVTDDPQRNDAKARSRATWQRVEAYLQEHPGQAAGRTAVARAVGVHPTYLSDLCRRHTGRSFGALVGDQRLQRARELLRRPDLDIGRIATLCGFASASYFIRVFRRAEGMTPGRYRETRGECPGR
jgi:AraC-like DNA-binding protein